MRTTLMATIRLFRPAGSFITALFAAGLVLPEAGAAQVSHPRDERTQVTQSRIPESLRAEHAKIHDELVRATQARGAVGTAARELAGVLDPHFEREEQIALPPLGLLAPLARGEFTASMREVLPLTDSLRAELPRMLEEHKAIHAATLKLGKAAQAAGNIRVARFAEDLALHARTEEEFSYPAAVLVGEIVRGRDTQ